MRRLGGALGGVLGGVLRVAVVSGPSMAPTLRDGDRVLVRRTRPSALRRGDVVLVELPAGWIVKRIAALPGDPAPAGDRVPPGHVLLLGDNPLWSVDSRDFGYVPTAHVFGVAIRRLP